MQVIQKLLPVHLRGVVVQHDQLHVLVCQILQGLSSALAHLHHLKMAIALHILPVNGRHHGVVL